MRDEKERMSLLATATSNRQTQNKPIGQTMNYALSGKKDKTAMQTVKKGAKVTGMAAACILVTGSCIALFFICIPAIGMAGP